MLDLKIIGGTIVDGTGAPGYRGDVGIRDGRIAVVGKVDEDARETIDAKGRIVAPGFIDAHTHYDAQCFWDPDLTPSCFHGVTTVMAGLCGFTIAPLSAESGNYLLPMLARVEGMPEDTLRTAVPWDWSTFGEYLDRLEGNLGINIGFMVGHTAVRRFVMGPRAVGQKATAEDMAAMKREVIAALDAGAMGFSSTTSLTHNDANGNPVPSRHASREELLELASLVRDYEGTSLELNPDMSFSDSVIELLTDVSLAGQRPVNWNLLVVSGNSEADLARIDRQLYAGKYAKERGARVMALTLPEGATIRVNFISGFIFDALPGWAPLFRLPLAERLERLGDPHFVQNMRVNAETGKTEMPHLTRWGNYVIDHTNSPKYKPFEGGTIGSAAAALGQDAYETLIDVTREDRLATIFRMNGNESAEAYELRGKLMRSEHALIGGSDSGAHMDMIDTYAFSTKALGKCREHDLMPLEEVVHLITQRIAHFYGLRDRGEIAVGAHADLVVFDAATVACGPAYIRYDLPGTKEHGRLYSEAIGINLVIVNGAPFVRNNVIVGRRKGTVLRAGRDSYTVKLPEPVFAA